MGGIEREREGEKKRRRHREIRTLIDLLQSNRGERERKKEQ